MPNRSTIDQVSALRLIIEKTREFRKGRHLYIAFIDLKAAFDSVDHASLRAILASIGVPDQILRLFKKLYGDSQSCVRINGKLSEWFNINSGIRQGCVAAPDLFNCVVDHLMSLVCTQIPAVSFDNLHLADLEYADNTILLSNDIEKLTAALSVYDRESRKLGLKVSWAKTKLMHVGEGPDPPSLNISGNAVEFADSFVYLGSTGTNNGDLKPEIERRCALSSNVMQTLRKPLWRQQSISRTTRLRIYNAPVLSVLLNDAETWPLTGTLSSRLDNFDSRALRSILGIHWRDLVSNETVRALAGQPPLWLPAAGSAGMDMCFACHRTILLGLSWTSTLTRSAGNDPEMAHAPVGLAWSNAILTSSASIQPQLNPSRRTVINGGLS